MYIKRIANCYFNMNLQLRQGVAKVIKPATIKFTLSLYYVFTFLVHKWTFKLRDLKFMALGHVLD